MKNKFFEEFSRYCIGIETANGRRLCIRGWYLDSRFNHVVCPRGYYMYEFREDPNDDSGYIAFVEPFVWCNHSGTFVTRSKIPFGENGNPIFFKIRYGHEY